MRRAVEVAVGLLHQPIGIRAVGLPAEGIEGGKRHALRRDRRHRQHGAGAGDRFQLLRSLAHLKNFLFSSEICSIIAIA